MWLGYTLGHDSDDVMTLSPAWMSLGATGTVCGETMDTCGVGALGGAHTFTTGVTTHLHGGAKPVWQEQRPRELSVGFPLRAI